MTYIGDIGPGLRRMGGSWFGATLPLAQTGDPGEDWPKRRSDVNTTPGNHTREPDKLTPLRPIFAEEMRRIHTSRASLVQGQATRVPKENVGRR